MMGKMETVLKSEITRLARREARSLTSRQAEDLRKLKRRVQGLESELAALKSLRAREQARVKVRRAVETVASDEAASTRLSPKLIKSLRRRLNLSQADLARLVGVSSVAVGSWESSKSKPRPETKARIVALRSVGRRDIKRLLAGQGG